LRQRMPYAWGSSQYRTECRERTTCSFHSLSEPIRTDLIAYSAQQVYGVPLASYGPQSYPGTLGRLLQSVRDLRLGQLVRALVTRSYSLTPSCVTGDRSFCAAVSSGVFLSTRRLSFLSISERSSSRE